MSEGSVSLWPMISIAINSRVKPVSMHVQCLRHLPLVSGGQSKNIVSSAPRSKLSSHERDVPTTVSTQCPLSIAQRQSIQDLRDPITARIGGNDRIIGGAVIELHHHLSLQCQVLRHTLLRICHH